MHLWRLELPTDLAIGEHTAEVIATDVHGREFTQTLTFEVTEYVLPTKPPVHGRRAQ